MTEEELARELNKHHRTKGMAVAMGVTCACGYWSDSEHRQGHRPFLPLGSDQLDLHRARIVLELLQNKD